VSDALGPLIASMRKVTQQPLCAGFGIATPEQAGQVARMADGVVVGSAIVRMIEQGSSASQLEAFARSLRQGMDTVA